MKSVAKGKTGRSPFSMNLGKMFGDFDNQGRFNVWIKRVAHFTRGDPFTYYTITPYLIDVSFFYYNDTQN